MTGHEPDEQCHFKDVTGKFHCEAKRKRREEIWLFQRLIAVIPCNFHCIREKTGLFCKSSFSWPAIDESDGGCNIWLLFPNFNYGACFEPICWILPSFQVHVINLI